MVALSLLATMDAWTENWTNILFLDFLHYGGSSFLHEDNVRLPWCFLPSLTIFISVNQEAYLPIQFSEVSSGTFSRTFSFKALLDDPVQSRGLSASCSA